MIPYFIFVEENVEPSNQSDLSGVETPPSEERSVEGQQEDMGTDASNNTGNISRQGGLLSYDL